LDGIGSSHSRSFWFQSHSQSPKFRSQIAQFKTEFTLFYFGFFLILFCLFFVLSKFRLSARHGTAHARASSDVFLLHTLMCTMNAPCGLGWVWSHLVTLLRIRRVSHWNCYLLFRLWLPCFDLPLAHTPQTRSTIDDRQPSGSLDEPKYCVCTIISTLADLERR